MLNWQGCRNVTENEKKAINTALEELNFSGKTTEEIQELINNDVIVLSDCRSGKHVYGTLMVMALIALYTLIIAKF